MILSDLSIRRPVLATVVNLVIVLVGLIAWDRLTIREFPNVDDPVVTITTNYLGANAEIIESQVTKPLEDGISGIEGVDYISSISRAEQSQISVRFSTGRDPDAAAMKFRLLVALIAPIDRRSDEIDAGGSRHPGGQATRTRTGFE